MVKELIYMPWTPLAERFSALPLILAGPILRRTEPHAVTVWLALKESSMVTLRIYTQDIAGTLIEQFSGTRHTVRLGDHLHLVAVTARASIHEEQLAWAGLSRTPASQLCAACSRSQRTQDTPRLLPQTTRRRQRYVTGYRHYAGRNGA